MAAAALDNVLVDDGEVAFAQIATASGASEMVERAFEISHSCIVVRA